MSDEWKARKAAGYTKKEVKYDQPGPITQAIEAAKKAEAAKEEQKS